LGLFSFISAEVFGAARRRKPVNRAGIKERQLIKTLPRLKWIRSNINGRLKYERNSRKVEGEFELSASEGYGEDRARSFVKEGILWQRRKSHQ
jgi:hypothetical protein